jgi:hypothetical protein
MNLKKEFKILIQKALKVGKAGIQIVHRHRQMMKFNKTLGN